MNRKPQEEIEEIDEEEDDYVNAPAWTVDKVAAPPDQRSLFFTQSFPLIAVCWLILLVIMGLRIHFTSVISKNDAKLTAEIQQPETLMQHLNLSKDNGTLLAAIQHLTNLKDKMSSDNKKLRRDYDDLTVQLGNLTQNYTVSESKITFLTTENLQLETQRNNLTEQIQNMKTNWNKVRQCKACQDGWLLTGSNCYVYHDADPPNQKTWEEAREDCRGKGADLVVVHSQEEKNVLNDYSRGSSVTIGYWIGLRAEGGRWKWIDGSDLTVSYWTQQPPPPTDGQCVMSVQNIGWRSVSCAEKQRWICEMKALSV